MPNRQRQMTGVRRRHTNSKLGCLNCKRKKIRCDENLPQCDNCVKSRRETCSYLSLSKGEINKIKLTHSLRNSHNKLLTQDYRLPASTTRAKPTIKAAPLSTNVEDSSLEFKFELLDLPLRIPPVMYPPIHFSNVSINDFSHEFNVVYESDFVNEESPRTETTSSALPNGITFKKSFTLHRSGLRDSIAQNPKSSTNLESLLVGYDSGLLDHLNPFFKDLKSKDGMVDIIVESQICMGQSIALNAFNQKREHKSLTSQAAASKSAFERNCHERWVNLLSQMEKAMKNNSWDQLRDAPKSRMEFISSAIYSTAVGHMLSGVMLNYSMESFLESQAYIVNILEVATNYLQSHSLKEIEFVHEQSETLTNAMLSIKIPSYWPTFLYEVYSNLVELHSLYNNHSFKFSTEVNKNRFQRYKGQYNSLTKFLEHQLLPIIISSRNEDYVLTYPPELIFQLASNWSRIVPPESMTHYPRHQPDADDETAYLKDISTTLYMYYISISVALDSVFPACKYLFNFSFSAPRRQFYAVKHIMTPRPQNSCYPPDINGNLIQKHNYYSMRLFAFFRRRYGFYEALPACIKVLITEENKKNRLRSRRFEHTMEVPITNFNTTLIRPSHYPPKTKIGLRQNVASFCHDDEHVTTPEIYSRNIETLDFFNKKSVIQYDYETMLLLPDYRPPPYRPSTYRTFLEITDVKEYCTDKRLIFSGWATEPATTKSI